MDRSDAALAGKPDRGYNRCKQQSKLPVQGELHFIVSLGRVCAAQVLLMFTMEAKGGAPSGTALFYSAAESILPSLVSTRTSRPRAR